MPNSLFFWRVFSNKDSSSRSKWCVYSKLNISCWLIVLTATHLLLLLSHRSWQEENSVIEKSRAWSLFAHIWQMGHHRFKGEHLETGGRKRVGGGRGWGWLWNKQCHTVQVKNIHIDKVTLSKSWSLQTSTSSVEKPVDGILHILFLIQMSHWHYRHIMILSDNHTSYVFHVFFLKVHFLCRDEILCPEIVLKHKQGTDKTDYVMIYGLLHTVYTTQ